MTDTILKTFIKNKIQIIIPISYFQNIKITHLIIHMAMGLLPPLCIILRLAKPPAAAEMGAYRPRVRVLFQPKAWLEGPTALQWAKEVMTPWISEHVKDAASVSSHHTCPSPGGSWCHKCPRVGMAFPSYFNPVRPPPRRSPAGPGLASLPGLPSCPEKGGVRSLPPECMLPGTCRRCVPCSDHGRSECRAANQTCRIVACQGPSCLRSATTRRQPLLRRPSTGPRAKPRLGSQLTPGTSEPWPRPWHAMSSKHTCRRKGRLA